MVRDFQNCDDPFKILGLSEESFFGYDDEHESPVAHFFATYCR